MQHTLFHCVAGLVRDSRLAIFVEVVDGAPAVETPVSGDHVEVSTWTGCESGGNLLEIELSPRSANNTFVA